MREAAGLDRALDRTLGAIARSLEGFGPDLRPIDVGTVRSVGEGVARVEGLPSVRSEELVRFPGGAVGMALGLEEDEVGVVLLDPGASIDAGDEVRGTGRLQDVPVGEALLGRIVDPIGRPLDDRGAVPAAERWPVEREAPAIMDRAPVETPLRTGLKVVDALVPIGRGQRELIVGDPQTGKTTLAVDTMLAQSGDDVVRVYCSIGRRASSVAEVVGVLREREALPHTVVVVAGGDDPPGLQLLAPYAAMTIAEWFMARGRDALVVLDDLTRHARAWRELSLLLRRPPGREAYPGDVFYLHSRLLERAARLRPGLGGGSLTALPIVEIQAGNIAAYIPTNLISITDGQIVLSSRAFHKGLLPAVDVGRSVSRVGGRAQLPAYRAIAGDLRLAYAQFEELEAFSRFGTTLDAETRRKLERGRRVREVLRQPAYDPVPAGDQIAVLLAAVEGALDGVPVERVGEAESAIREAARAERSELLDHLVAGAAPEPDDLAALKATVRRAAARFEEEGVDGHAPGSR